MTTDIVGCDAVRSEHNEAPACCSSCHADADDFDVLLCEVTLPDGRIAEVCCAVGSWLHRNAGTREGER